MFPFYEEKDTESVQSRIMANQTAFIDPRFISRNYFEKNLFDIVQLCWVHNPDDRIDIFSLVYRLRALTKEFNNWEGRTLQMQQAVIHKIKEKSPVSVTG